MVGFDKLVEGRSALARGELDDLPGAAVPMHLDDDRLVPEELRMAHRVLKNSGCLPQEVSLRAQIGLLAYEDQQTGRAQTNLSLVML
ncbi:MAG: DUF1992 domain-containing protein, partial [Chromatiales bacterium]|nr:DUF1992 domain-containing protein [Chromatiales bacterium]